MRTVLCWLGGSILSPPVPPPPRGGPEPAGAEMERETEKEGTGETERETEGETERETEGETDAETDAKKKTRDRKTSDGGNIWSCCKYGTSVL